jgi:hypothetical protein
MKNLKFGVLALAVTLVLGSAFTTKKFTSYYWFAHNSKSAYRTTSAFTPDDEAAALNTIHSTTDYKTSGTDKVEDGYLGTELNVTDDVTFGASDNVNPSVFIYNDNL